MARFQFMFTVLCPICNEHFEISHFDIEVICNGQVWHCTRCNGEIGLHLTPLTPDGLKSWGNLGKCTICGKAWEDCSCLTAAGKAIRR